MPVAQSEVCVFDEVKEIITMPRFDAAKAQKLKNAEDIELSAVVIWQLHDYVTSISTMYRDNPFHCFEHAGHVTMSVMKLLSRVVCTMDYTDMMVDEEILGSSGRTGEKKLDELNSARKKNELEKNDFSWNKQ